MSLEAWLRDPVVVQGLVQVAAATALALAVVALARSRRLGVAGEAGVALARGFVQILAMGAVLGLVLTASLAWSALLLGLMAAGAAWISHSRAAGLPGAFAVSLTGVALGAGATIAAMTAAGAIRPEPRNLLPVGSMIVAYSMRTNSLALERLRGELTERRDRIEAALALGAAPTAAAQPALERAVRAALIPTIDSLKSLGLVWIPGLMAGMVLAGANPIYAAEYQFVIMAMIFAAGGLTAMASAVLMGGRVFTDAEQLRRLAEPQRRA